MTTLKDLVRAVQTDLPITVRMEAWMLANSDPVYSEAAIQFSDDFLRKRVGGNRNNRKPHFRASGMGKCARARVLARIGTPGVSEQYSSTQANTFATGNFMHRKWQMAGLTEGWLVKAEVPLENDEEDLGGTADGYIYDGSLFEFKGLALDTLLPTPTGWTTMGEVQVGDVLLDRAGHPTTVTGVSEVKHLRCYELQFRNGQSVVCDEEHRWVARVGDSRQREKVHPVQLLARAKEGGGRVIVPVAEPLQLPESELPIDPWVLGYWLGNGSKAGAVISCHRDDADEIAQHHILAGYGAKTALDQRSKAASISISGGLRSALIALGLLGGKTVPTRYLRASESQRLALLRGLMDSDGSWSKRRSRAVFTSTQRGLADAVAELVRSLGGRAQFKIVARSGYGCEVTSYDVDYTLPVCPFTLERKAALYRQIEKRHQHAVVSIREVPSVPTKCVAVDSPSRTYLCGEAMIPTHNTANDRSYGFVVHRKEPLDEHQLQVAGYKLLDPTLTKASIVYENKNTGEWREYRVDFTDELMTKVKDELHGLRDAIATQTLPKPLLACTVREGMTYRRCPFREICLAMYDADQNWPTTTKEHE